MDMAAPRSQKARHASERVLVARLNHAADLKIAREAGWYRVPIPSAEKWLARR
jgi:hypothetical protein